MKALSNCGNQEHSSQEDGDAHVLVSGLSGLCALIGYVRSLLTQTKELFVLGVVVIGHEDRARRRLRVVERIGAKPGRKCAAVLIAKTALEELRRLLLIIELGGEPTIERVAVVDPLLPCQGGKAFGSNSEPTRLGVLLCASSSPRCCLVSAPRSGHSNKGEDQRLDNFNRFKAALGSMTVLAHLV